MTTLPRGLYTALITPFTSSGAVDLEGLKQNIEDQIAAHVAGVIIIGSTGEASTLTSEEEKVMIQLAAEVIDSRATLVVGIGSPSTHTCLKKLEVAATYGADAALVLSPYCNKPTQEGMIQHFKAIASSTNLPVILYNVPGRTAVNLDPATVVRLAEAAPNIQAIKEASGKLPQIAELVHSLPRSFKVFTGDDNLALAAIGIGAHGLISVAANEAPAEVGSMIRAALNNNWSDARATERKYSRLFEANFWESNPGPVKTVLQLMGRTTDTVRLPLVPPTAATRARLEKLVGELGLLKHAPLPEGDLGLF